MRRLPPRAESIPYRVRRRARASLLIRTRADSVMNGSITLFLADAIADERGVLAAPGAILARWNDPWPSVDIIAAGDPKRVGDHDEANRATVCELPGCLITPGFVNAHAHLDLTSVGPRPFGRGAEFAHWLADIRQRRPQTETAIRESVRLGVERSLQGGVVAIGDIAGAWSVIPIDELRNSPLKGISFFEVFGLGEATEAVSRLDDMLPSVDLDVNGVRFGVQPHAPYSAGIRLYERANSLNREQGLALCTHLGESIAESDLIVRREGPIRSFLESLGLWTNEAAGDFGQAPTSVAHCERILQGAPWLVAHVNDCSDDDLQRLRATGASLAYCPRASAYFGHERDFGPHRYRDMVASGIPVALGTDSVVGLPPAESDRLSVLDEMRFLWRRDGADPTMLLGMATTNGAAALGLPPDDFRLSLGATAGLVAIPMAEKWDSDPLEAALESDEAPKLLRDESGSRLTATQGRH